MRDGKWMSDANLREYDSAEASDATSVDTGDYTLVQQHYAEEVDINTIVRRFGLTQELPRGVREGVYGDFSGITGFEDALSQIERARDSFMRLPAEVRQGFDNDPARLIKFVEESTEAEFSARWESFKPKPAVSVPPVSVPPGGEVTP